VVTGVLETSPWLLPEDKPLVQPLVHFSFLVGRDLQLILNSPWILDRGVLMLKHWTPGFSPFSSSFSKRNLWMLLPDFPLELWSLPVFEAIANTVGKFVFFDSRSLNWINKCVAWVLVEIDLESGLLDSIDVNIGDLSFRQPLDFWREPFRCHLCWQIGHLRNSCSLAKSAHSRTTLEQVGISTSTDFGPRHLPR
jgi:hypothetical protein